MAARNSLELILNQVKHLNLNFQIQQSPFSATILLKSSFIKDKFGHPEMPPSPNTDLLRSLSKDNQTLVDKVSHLEDKIDIINRNYNNALKDVETSSQTISKLEKDLEFSLQQNGTLTAINKKLEAKNNKLENEMDEMRDSLESETNEKIILENVVNETKIDLKEGKKSVKELKKLNETLENKLRNFESESRNLITVTNAKDCEIDHLKSKSFELAARNSSTESKSTTPSVLYSTTSTQSSPIIKVQDKCNHSAGCFVRQPRTPPYFPQSKCNYISPPSNNRLLPFNVDTYQDFRKLHSSHDCEECADGSLFHNYFEIVQYPDPGPCGGTSGSQVKSCPNPNSKITIRSEEKKRKWKKHIKCNLCDEVFSSKGNITFHMNRKHGPI